MSRDDRSPLETEEALSDQRDGYGAKSEVKYPSQDKGRPEKLKRARGGSEENNTRGKGWRETSSGEVAVGRVYT